MNPHVEYEYNMLNIVYGYSTATGQLSIDTVVWNNMQNIVIGSCARNLIHYMKTNGLKIPNEVDDIIIKISDQILNLDTSRRTEVTEEKIQPSDWKILKDFVEENISLVR